MKERTYIAAEVVIAIIPIMGLLLWASILWPKALSSVVHGEFSLFVLTLAFCVPAGWVGVTGIFIMGINLATAKNSSSNSIVFMVVIGLISGLLAGYTFFFKVWWLAWLVVLPILVSIHLLWLTNQNEKDI